MSGRTDDNNNDDEDEFNKRWGGFDFCRLSGVVILTFIFVAVALIIDELSFAAREEKQCFVNESPCPTDNDGVEQWHVCKLTSRCGWRFGKWTYEKKLYQALPNNPLTTDDYPYKGLTAANGDPFPLCGGPLALTHWSTDVFTFTYKAGYAKVCNRKNDLVPLRRTKKDSCVAYNAGNIWMIFNVVSLIITIFTMILLLPLYCRHKSCFPCEFCNEQTAIILGALFTATWICQFIACAYWLVAQPCDNADEYYRYNFTQPITNWISYSMGLVLIAMVANCVACGTVCFCWGDNREYGENPDETDKEYAIKPSTRKDPFKTTEDRYE